MSSSDSGFSVGMVTAKKFAAGKASKVVSAMSGRISSRSVTALRLRASLKMETSRGSRVTRRRVTASRLSVPRFTTRSFTPVISPSSVGGTVMRLVCGRVVSRASTEMSVSPRMM